MRKLLAWFSLCAVVLAFAASCASKAPPVVAGAPKHPDFMFPVAPEGTLPAQASRLDRGWQYLQQGDFRNAERELSAALKQQVNFYPAEAASAYVALARGNEADALTRFDRALATEPAYVPALVGRGQALLAMDRVGDALVSFEAALAKDASLTDLKGRVDVLRFRATQDMLARAKAASEGRRWDEAKAAYEQAIAASPDSAFLYRDLAAVEQKSGDADLALEHYRKAVDLDAGDARSWAAIGSLLEGTDDVAGALSAYERARSIDPAEVPDAVLTRLRANAALLKLPAEYRAIPGNVGVARGEIAALIGIRLDALVARARPRQLIITDIRSHWAQQWINTVARAGIMDPLPNYEFQPGLRVRRGELALTVSRLLALVGAAKPELQKKWQATKVAVADVPVGHLSYAYVSQAVAAGIMPLVNGNFELLRSVTGAEAIEIIGRIEALAPAMSTHVFTLANQLTMLRMLLVPVFVLLTLYGQFGWALLTFMFAGATDLLDGLAARKTSGKTDLGAWLDPIADKLLIGATFIVLTLPNIGLVNRLPLWLTITVLSRDVGILLTVAIVNLAIGPRTFRPSPLGKLATFIFVVSCVVVMFFNYRGYASHWVDLAVWVSLTVTLASWVDYVWRLARIINK